MSSSSLQSSSSRVGGSLKRTVRVSTEGPGVREDGGGERVQGGEGLQLCEGERSQVRGGEWS
jgi:hypothetical protein